jgi:hypothetical protein
MVRPPGTSTGKGKRLFENIFIFSLMIFKEIIFVDYVATPPYFREKVFKNF